MALGNWNNYFNTISVNKKILHKLDNTCWIYCIIRKYRLHAYKKYYKMRNMEYEQIVNKLLEEIKNIH